MSFIRNGLTETIFDPLAVPYNYKYNGKELQETGFYDFEARTYMSDAPRFLQIDPLADEPEQIDKSPYAAFWNNPIIYNDPDGKCPRCIKALAKTAVKSVVKGKLDLGEVYDFVDAVKTIADPNASMLDKGLAVFDIVSPVSSKEMKAGAKLLGVADNANDVKKAAKKGEGVIYRVPGNKTPSGKPYIGSSDDLKKRAKNAKDGRVRDDAEVVDTYTIGNSRERKVKEQKAMDEEMKNQGRTPLYEVCNFVAQKNDSRGLLRLRK